jgi:hypothetical protein
MHQFLSNPHSNKIVGFVVLACIVVWAFAMEALLGQKDRAVTK